MFSTGCYACHFERILPHEFTLLLAYLLEKRYFTLTELNMKIESFQYNYHEIKDKPSSIQREAIRGTKKIGQNACQMWLLGILFPLLVASVIPTTDPHWLCYGILLKILTLCMSQVISPMMVGRLQDLIQDHHSRFSALYPGQMLPKFHFLVYLPDIILRFGPPRSYWCMRFEGKNRFFKQVLCGNFKNVPLTLAHEHQLWMCLPPNIRKFFYKKEMKSKENCFITSELFDELISYLEVQASSPFLLLICKHVKINGIEYREGALVWLNAEYARNACHCCGLITAYNKLNFLAAKFMK